MIVSIAIVLLAVLLPVTLQDLLRRPVIRRLGLRNVVRRRGEAALVVGGSMLASALIVASIVVGTSFDRSIRDLAADELGPIDEFVVVEDAAAADRLAAAIEGSADAGDLAVDGVLPILMTEVPVVGADSAVEPRVPVYELDLDTAAGFGGDRDATGLSTGSGDVVVVESLAEELGIGAGDAVEVVLGAVRIPLTVGGVAAGEGLAGGAELIVDTGVLTDAAVARGISLDGAVRRTVAVSNEGDVFDGATRTDEVVAGLESIAAAEGVAIDVETPKQTLLEIAEAEGAEMTELFGTIGGFSVAAGILLVVNLFVMLAGERTVELGTQRAVGLRRGVVVRAFALEGLAYGLMAAAVGAIAGIGVGAAVMVVAAAIFDDGGIRISLAVEATDLWQGAVIGLAISQLTVVLTSIRSTRLNIVRALKDLGPAARSAHPIRSTALSLAAVAGGAALFVLAPDNAYASMFGPVLVAVGAIPVLGLVTGRRTATAIGSALAVVWPVAVFGVRSETMTDPDVGVFLLQGLLLVGAATALSASLERLWLRASRSVAPAGIAARLGMAHALDRPVRSALLVAMYALVIFTVTFMAVINSAFMASSGELARQVGGGYDLIVESSPTAEGVENRLAADPDVAVVSVVRSTVVEVSGLTPIDDGDGAGDDAADPGDDGARWAISVVDDGWQPSLAPELVTTIDDRSDADVWNGVRDGAWVVAPDYGGFEVGDVITLGDGSERSVEATVAGLSKNNWLVSSGIYVADTLADPVIGAEPVDRWYVELVGADDPEALEDAVVDRWESELVESGVVVDGFRARAEAELVAQEGFFRMLQGYLGLGLLIGITGLGVVLIRAVRERRRELGMLAAVGVPADQVRRTFRIEAAFVGLQGVALGIGLGTLSAWQVVTTGAFEENLTFDLPLVWLGAFVIVAVVASVGAAVVPARRAARTLPAVALRVTG